MIQCETCNGTGKIRSMSHPTGFIECDECFGKGEITELDKEINQQLKKTAFIKVIMPSEPQVRSNKVKFMVGDLRLPVTDFTISPDGERNIMKLTIKIDPNYFQIVTEENK